jgi:uncharacterized protein
LLAAMHAWEGARDSVLGDLARRLRARSLFKTIEIYDEGGSDRERVLLTARDVAATSGLDPDAYVGLDIASDTPFANDDDRLMIVFPHGPPRRPADVSFLLRRLSGETVTRVRLIFAPELRDRMLAAIEP